jgi:hypothetical protein
MNEPMRYLTPRWLDEAEKRLKSELSPERMNFITSLFPLTIKEIR